MNILFLMKKTKDHHMICIGKTKCTSEKGLLSVNTHKPAESGAECVKRICLTTGRLRQIFFMI